jgi:hypothetical protein
MIMEDQETSRSGVLTAGEADGGGDKGSRDATVVNLDTLESLGTISLNCQRIRISVLPDSRLKGFFCTNL